MRREPSLGNFAIGIPGFRRKGFSFAIPSVIAGGRGGGDSRMRVRACGYVGVRICGCWVMWVCGYVSVGICRRGEMWMCGRGSGEALCYRGSRASERLERVKPEVDCGYSSSAWTVDV